MTGQRFGRLTVLKKSDKRDSSRAQFWLCKCDCGTVRPISGQSLKRGITKSCGCLRTEKSHENVKLAFAAIKPAKTKRAVEEIELCADDDLWMFGSHAQIKRLQKMFF